MEGYPQLFNLIPKEFVRRHEVCEEKKLELKLGPPGEDKSPPLSLGYTSSNTHKRGFQHTVETKGGERKWMKNSSSSSSSSELTNPIISPKFPFSSSVSGVPNTSQKRIVMPPVVGWPPVRSFRKNLATSSSTKMAPESLTDIPDISGAKLPENLENTLFVKINMDGVPIGRKVDLKAYDNYEKLSSAVDELFRGLLAAQGDSFAALNKSKMEKTKAITGLLDGMGEYTLVYEDNEGDRMLVGDVPWHMFISSAKRLRVLKRSELSTLRLSSSKLPSAPLDSAVVKESCTCPTV